MTIIEYRSTAENILDCIEDGIRNLKDSDTEPRFICCGPKSYENLCNGISSRFNRELQNYETYSFIPIVIDPFRGDTVCVLPAPRTVIKGVEAIKV